MAMEVRLPQWGMNMQEGTVVEWLKKEGEHLSRGDALVTIEAAKAVETMEAPVSGLLAIIHVQPGQTVPVRTVLCTIGELSPTMAESGETKPDEASSLQSSPPRSVRSEVETPELKVSPVARRLAEGWRIDLGQIRGSGPGGRILQSDVRRAIDATDATGQPRVGVQVEPRARRLAKEFGVSLGSVQGSGPGERITEEDVRRVIETSSHTSDAHIIPLTGMRGSIAHNMVTSLQSMAQLTLISEVDVSDLVALKTDLAKESDLTYTPLIVKAVAQALEEHPRLNALVEGDAIRLVDGIHIGVAVALDEGLIVPVVRDANRKTIRQIGTEIDRLVKEARAGRALASAVTGGTFTVTNLGPLGVDAFTPIVNPPEVAILGVGRIREVLTRGEDALLWRQMMTLSLTFDHRAVDGVPAAIFLKAVAELLENPEWAD